MNTIGIALAGFGAIGRIHHLAYRDIPLYYPGQLPEIRLEGVLRSSAESSRKTAEAEGFVKGYASFEEILEDPQVHIIDLVTPNYMHKDQILQALRAGKHILCEKPLALNGSEADEILKEVKISTSQVGMVFNYRFVPAIMKARELIDQGRLERFTPSGVSTFIRAIRIPAALQLADEFQQIRRGALADLGVHVLDLLNYLLGDFDSIRAETQTYIKERPVPGEKGRMEKVTVDDAAWLQCTLSSGGKGSVEVSRFATGTLDELNITIYGSRGALRFNLMDPGFLYFFEEVNKSNGWCRLETMQHYPGAALPNPRSVIGWPRFHLENQYRFLKALEEKKAFAPGAYEGARAQYVLDAAYASALSRRNEKVKKILP